MGVGIPHHPAVSRAHDWACWGKADAGEREGGWTQPARVQGVGVSGRAFTVRSDELQEEIRSLPDSLTHPELALHRSQL